MSKTKESLSERVYKMLLENHKENPMDTQMLGGMVSKITKNNKDVNHSVHTSVRSTETDKKNQMKKDMLKKVIQKIDGGKMCDGGQMCCPKCGMDMVMMEGGVIPNPTPKPKIEGGKKPMSKPMSKPKKKLNEELVAYNTFIKHLKTKKNMTHKEATDFARKVKKDLNNDEELKGGNFWSKLLKGIKQGAEIVAPFVPLLL